MSQTYPCGVVTVVSQPVWRGGPSVVPPPVKFHVSSVQLTWAWGSDGAEATIIYDWSGVPVTTGYNLTIETAGHIFWGVCTDDAPRESSTGLTRELKFKDFLLYLKYDQVYGSFNKLDDHIVNGRRQKRYFHYLPDLRLPVTLFPTLWQYDASGNPMLFIDNQVNGYGVAVNPGSPTDAPAAPPGPYFSGFIKTYTTAPLTAAQIILIILNSTTVKDVWTCSFHPDQFNYPVYGIDATGGKSLQAILQEISDAQGLVFAQVGAPLNLYWIRKGQLDARYPEEIPLTPPLETNPATGEQQLLTDDRILGTSLSGHPTQVQILGDRNTYLVLNIPLVPGWSPGWEAMWSVNLFRDDIYQRGVTADAVTIGAHTFPVGTAFKTIGASKYDPEQIIARQLAVVASMNMTVAQYAQLRNETPFDPSSIANPVWCDYKKFAGKSRLDMPAELYITQILLRAFQFPAGFQITNAQGVMVPLDSLEVLDKLIARVTYDPKTGTMSADPLVAADGTGLALALGYEVGKDLFAKINPGRFDLSTWNNAQNVWSAQEFTIDDTGEPGGKTVLFDSPIIKSATLVKIVDGYGVFNGAPTKSDGETPGFDIPQVQIGCCFSAERYSFFSTEFLGGRVETMQIGGLNKEFICTYGQTGVGGFTEVKYSDGLTADQKAIQFVAPLELLQYIYDKGGYQHLLLQNPETGAFPNGMQLNPFIDG